MKVSKTLYFLGILIAVSCLLLLVRYFWGYENFWGGGRGGGSSSSSSSGCKFKKLGTYNLTTTALTDADTGKIYISALTSWDNITATHPDDTSYTYTSFTPVDASGVLVKQLINNVMKCNGIDVYDNELGINTKPALILCLEATVPSSASARTAAANVASRYITTALNTAYNLSGSTETSVKTAVDTAVTSAPTVTNTSDATVATAVYTAATTAAATALAATGATALSVKTAVIAALATAVTAAGTAATGDTNSSISRVFFVKSWVPFGTTSVNNVIAGEIAGNETSNNAYKPPAKAVAILQRKEGLPSTSLTYTLSYTICPASSRPEGFSYTDCCSGITNSTSVAPVAMTNADTSCCTSNNVCTPLVVKKSKGEDCSTGLECTSGNCQYGKCGDSVSLGAAEGETCATTSDCASGLKCSDSKKCSHEGAGISKYCKDHPSGYDPDTGRACSHESGPSELLCSNNSDCASPTKCVDGKCKLPDSESKWENRDWAHRGESNYDPYNLYSDSNHDSDDYLPSESEGNHHHSLAGLGSESREWNTRDSSNWSGFGNRHRGSDKDYHDQLERLEAQKYKESKGGSMKWLKPGFDTCNKLYNCNGGDDDDDDTCEGFASLKNM